MNNLNDIINKQFAGVTSYLFQWQTIYNQHLKDVTISVEDLKGAHDEVRQIMEQLSVAQLQASTQEGESMNENLIELKERTARIDQSVQRLETDIAVLKNTIELKFDAISTTLTEIKSGIQPIGTLSIQMVEAKKDIEYIKKEQENAVTTKKWLVTTIIATVAAIAAIVKIIIG